MIYRYTLKNTFNLDLTWENMSFDYFCENINLLIEKWIDEHDEFNPKDMINITEQLMNQYSLIQYNINIKQRNSLSSIINSIKKIVII